MQARGFTIDDRIVFGRAPGRNDRLAYSQALERNHELPQAREVARDQLEISSDQFLSAFIVDRRNPLRHQCFRKIPKCSVARNSLRQTRPTTESSGSTHPAATFPARARYSF